MPIASWNTFKENYTENKPEEDRTIQKALEHFNKFAIKPFSIVQQQDGQNHREMLHDAKLSNGETTIKIEAKTDHVSRHSGNFFIDRNLLVDIMEWAPRSEDLLARFTKNGNILTLLDDPIMLRNFCAHNKEPLLSVPYSSVNHLFNN